MADWKSSDPATDIAQKSNQWSGLNYARWVNDDYNKKDTGLIVKRYARALKQLGEDEPKVFPFKDLLPAAEQDTTLDPFDATEMLGTGRSSPARPAATPGPR